MKELIINFCNKQINKHEKAKEKAKDDAEKRYHEGSINSYRKIIDLLHNQN